MHDFVIAHRGASFDAPENTEAAIRRAAADGAKAIEVDTTICHDGRMVIHHDHDLARCTNGSGYIADQSFEALQKLDSGHWFDPQFSGQKILSLEALLALCETLELALNLELKPPVGLERDCVTQASSLLRSSRVEAVVSSFSHRALQIHKQYFPEQARAVLFERIGEDFIDTANALNAQAIHFWAKAPLLEAQIAQAKSAGLLLRCFTVNQIETAKTLKHQGIDAVFTDKPKLMLDAGL